MCQPTTSHYSFGDNDIAAARLELLAATYAPSSSAFLRAMLPASVERAVDLGCGLGLTTALLREVSGATFVAGYERSPQYLQHAATRFPSITFRQLDVLVPPYPDHDLDAVFCRFLLTHVHHPEAVLAASLERLRRGGRLLIEEVGGLASDLPVLQQYYALVQEMQAHYGQELYMGLRVPAMAEAQPSCRVTVLRTSVELDTTTMARLHAMNIATWKHDPYMLEAHGIPKLDRLELALNAMASTVASLPPVTSLMVQVAVERR